MLTIIKVSPDLDGRHGLQRQSHREQCWLEGWVAVPAALEQTAWECGGYCQLQMENGALVKITPAQQPEQEEPVTAEEQLRADIDYLAAMTGVTL